jgi:hypothetical protein
VTKGILYENFQKDRQSSQPYYRGNGILYQVVYQVGQVIYCSAKVWPPAGLPKARDPDVGTRRAVPSVTGAIVGERIS